MEYTCYHGTCCTIEKFSHEFIGENTAGNAGSFYFTDDIKVANDYSIEAYKRKYEYDFETGEYMDECELQEKAEEQAHVYKCKVKLNNPLIVDISEVCSKDKYIIQQYGNNVIDTLGVMFIINIMQGGAHEKNAHVEIEFKEDYLHFFEEEIYNEETEEYEHIEKEPYDGLIIKDCIDGIGDYSNWMPSTVIIALHDWQIQIQECIKL